MQQHAPRERPIGRRVFGRDPTVYDRSRFDYPPRVFEVLRRRCGVGPSSVVLEIGPGTGKATRQLLAEGVASVLAIEPNPRLAGYLRTHLGNGSQRAEVRVRGFEEARLPSAHFDLVAAATSFHWLDERRALRKVARVLKPGGWWAAWWNHHGDPQRPSALSRAIHTLYGEPDSTWGTWLRTARADARNERKRRLALLRSNGRFDRIFAEDARWAVRLSSAHVRGLWSTFSEVATLPPGRRARFRDGVERMVDERFGGEVRLSVVTPIYTARRA